MATPFNKEKFFVINKAFVFVTLLIEVIIIIVTIIVYNLHDVYVCQQPKDTQFIVKNSSGLECTKLK